MKNAVTSLTSFFGLGALVILNAGCAQIDLPDSGTTGPRTTEPRTSGPDDAGLADGGNDRRIDVFEVLAYPNDGELEVRWSAPGAESCALQEQTNALDGPVPLPAAGTRRLPITYSDLPGGTPAPFALTLRCFWGQTQMQIDVSLDVPYVASFTSAPSSLPSGGGEATLCWDLRGEEVRVEQSEGACAIFAMSSGEYYYPLQEADCLFPITVDEPSSFLLYCSPDNGYVERTLFVDVAP